MPTDDHGFVPGRLSPQGREILRRIIAFLFWVFARVTIHGLEHLPEGGFLLTPNHLSRFDAPLAFVALKGRTPTAFVGSTYRRHLFFRWIVEMVDVIWVNRGATSPSVIKAALRALQTGRVLGVAPEGTRSSTHALIIGKTGAAFLAHTTHATIVPVAVINTEHLGRNMWRLNRIPLTIRFGPPYQLPPPVGRANAAYLEACTVEIMCRIAALLPPEYRGVYADHPRTKELLTADG
jgi:1-acyl-sn-glycerol-3-phosphate acyltransferase